MRDQLVEQFVNAAREPGDDIAGPALLLARVAYPRLDPNHYLGWIEKAGAAARTRIHAETGAGAPRRVRLKTITDFFFGDLGFAGNQEQYDDPRNSFLNDVIARRRGIPITLAVVFMELARRAGLSLEGVNFPGHFLLRCPPDPTDPEDSRAILIDPFHGGAVLDELDCLRLLRRHAGDEALLDSRTLATAGKREILIRMLMNLKRAYVRLHSFPQAREIAELLVALDPTALTELRDRGLLAAHLHEYAAALRDLETWLRLAPQEGDEEFRAVRNQVWDHVKHLRRRLASLN